MSGLRPMIDAAVASAIAEHPKYFTELGCDNNRARTAIVRKIMAALRGDGDKAGEGVAEAAGTPAAPQPLSAPPDSREARAYAHLRRLAGALPQFRSSDGCTFIGAEANNAAVFALADLPDEKHWRFYSGRHAGAWLEFFATTLPGVAKRPIAEKRGEVTGVVMPWPWPPSKDGKIYADESEDAA